MLSKLKFMQRGAEEKKRQKVEHSQAGGAADSAPPRLPLFQKNNTTSPRYISQDSVLVRVV